MCLRSCARCSAGGEAGQFVGSPPGFLLNAVKDGGLNSITEAAIQPAQIVRAPIGTPRTKGLFRVILGKGGMIAAGEFRERCD